MVGVCKTISRKVSQFTPFVAVSLNSLRLLVKVWLDANPNEGELIPCTHSVLTDKR
jgi:hypothetical protein